jgi:lambda family phage portal protein
LREVIRHIPKIQPNMVDKLVGYLNPVMAAKRLRARAAIAILNSYEGARKDKRSLSVWTTFAADPDSDILWDLPELRSRSRDLIRNNPLASGAIKKKLAWVVGAGFRHRSVIDRTILNLSEDQADEWEAKTEREWKLFWDTKEVDLSRTLDGLAITRQVYQQLLENGDVFVLFPRRARTNSAYDLRLQIIEADRVENKDTELDSPTLAGGIKKDSDGAPTEYHILKQHPGNLLHGTTKEWIIYPAFGRNTGLRNVIHLFDQARPGQSRGVPDLAPVMEPIKQLGRYTDAEIMAAVISSYFTVFIETETGVGNFDYTNLGDETGRQSADKDYKLGMGSIIELAQGEKIHDSNPGRPNDSFDPFVLAIMRQIGVALQIPFEILVNHFTASFSAARAAINEMWKFVLSERSHIANNFLRLVYEVWMWEAISTGRIDAPGFFSDALIRQAYLGAKWIGPAKGQIQEQQEVEAANLRVQYGFSTLQDETAQLTGGDWEQNHPQQVKETKKRREDGLIMEIDSAKTEEK